MKHKKMALTAGLLVFLVLGWFFSLRSATGMESREKQRALLEKADRYAENELWVRAIPLYQEALQYKTRDNDEIGSRLLAAYSGHGDTDSYIALVAKRAAENAASAQEYINAADFCIESLDLEQGMKLIKMGIEQTELERLVDYYEEHRYAYTVNVTKYEEIVPTKNSDSMPARTEDRWCYVDANGREMVAGPFEEASRFNNDGYAAVKMDGKYYTILKSGDKYGVDETGVEGVCDMSGSRILAMRDGKYGYYDYDFKSLSAEHQYEEMTVNANGVAAVKKDGSWGIIADGGKTVVDFTLQDVAVNSLGAAFSDGRAMVKMDGLWYLIDTKGKKISESGFAEAKAPESAGPIAVGDGEKWGFIDGTGALVIDYQYADALSFSVGLAPVKIVDTWNYISAKNKRVIDQEFTKALPFHGKLAVAEIMGKAALVELEYTEMQ